MWQSLIESTEMSISGGCLGIGPGMMASYLITTCGNLTPIISLDPIIVSFVFASLVGIFFGIYPARKAAMSNVINVLQYES